MRKAAIVLWGGIFSLALFLGCAQAADKLGYIDLSRTFNEYKKTKAYEKALTDKEKAFSDEFDKKVADIKAFQDKMNLLNDKQREEKRSELQAKAKSLQEFEQQKKSELLKEQEDKMKDLMKDIEEAVKKYSEKEGFTMVFNDRVLVYQVKGMDITSQVIDILNKGK